MKNLYNVHVGLRYTANILVEAETEEKAKEIVSSNLDAIDYSDMDFASDDYDVRREKPSDYTKYYVMNEQGNFEERRT